jgi:anti-sigma B factor antagonist
MRLDPARHTAEGTSMAGLARHFQNLRVTRAVHGDAVVVTVSGEVDLDTVGLLEKGLTAARERAFPSRAMVVDLREVRFFGAAGVTALVKADIGCQEQGVVLQIVANHRAVLRPLEIVELIETLPMARDLRPEWDRRRHAIPLHRSLVAPELRQPFSAVRAGLARRTLRPTTRPMVTRLMTGCGRPGRR